MATSRISEVKSSRDAASAHAELRNTFHRLAEVHAAAVPGLAEQLEGRVHELAIPKPEVVQDLLRGHLRGEASHETAATRAKPPRERPSSHTRPRDAIDASRTTLEAFRDVERTRVNLEPRGRSTRSEWPQIRK